MEKLDRLVHSAPSAGGIRILVQPYVKNRFKLFFIADKLVSSSSRFCLFDGPPMISFRFAVHCSVFVKVHR